MGKDDDGKPARPFNMIRANDLTKRIIKKFKAEAAKEAAGKGEADADEATAAETAAEL
jgi:hypothetical protein